MSCIGWRLLVLGVACGGGIRAVKCLFTAAVDIGTIVTGDACNICDNYDVDKIYVGRACGGPV
jgi:hypothetical protein